MRQLLKSYHAKNSDKPTATSPPIDKTAPLFLIVARSGAKVASTLLKQTNLLPTTSHFYSFDKAGATKTNILILSLLQITYFAKAIISLSCFSFHELFTF